MSDYSLTPVEFDVCWRLLDLGPLPVVFGVLPSPGTTHTERDRIVADTLAGLSADGLADENGPAPALAWALSALAEAGPTVDARLVRAGRWIRALATPDHGVLAALSPDVMRVRVLGEQDVLGAVASLAGPAPRGRGESVSVPIELLDRAMAAGGSAWRIADRLVDHGRMPPAQARALARMVAETVAFGQFGATAHVAGRRQRAGRVVGYHDTSAGRYLILPDDSGWLTVTPCRPEALRAELARLLAGS